MGGIPTIGDILLLSQLAWKIGCAFTSGRAGAPQEFQEVENELTGLTSALDLLAETLDDDDGILVSASDKTKAGVNKVLVCCRQTLQDLNSLVTRYQEIKRTDSSGPGGEQGVERSWKRLLVRNYKTIWWTTEGGNIQALRSMLQMHHNSISLTMQALQSKSLTRLEKTIAPMGVKVDEVHDLVIGNLNTKIDDMHHLMLSMANQQQHSDSELGSPKMIARDEIWSRQTLPSLDGRESGRSSANGWHGVNKGERAPGAYPLSPRRTPEPDFSQLSQRSDDERRPSVTSLGSQNSLVGTSRRALSPRLLPETREEIEYSSDMEVDKRRSSLMVAASPRNDQQPRLSRSHEREYQLSQSSRGYDNSSRLYENPDSFSRVYTPSSPRRPSDQPSSPIPTSPAMLPPPAVTMPPQPMSIDQTGPISIPEPASARRPSCPPSEFFDTPTSGPQLSLTPRVEPEKDILTRPTTTESQHQAFERDLWKNAVTLCQLKGKLVEYTKWDVAEDDFKMLDAAQQCMIYLIQRQEPRENGDIRFVSSVWALSNDRTVRLQQKLADGESIVPYTCWGTKSKVTLRVKSVLKFHDVVHGAKPLATAETSWVNYIFENEEDSTAFQSALMGKTLLLSVKTNKTLRVHEGFTGSFAFQEQMCGLENLRIWHDADSNGVLAMLHYTPVFRDGYMAFYLNSARDRIRIREDGDRCIKIKGLDIAIDAKPGALAKTNTASSRGRSRSNSVLQDPTIIAEVIKEEKEKEKAKAAKAKSPRIQACRVEFTSEGDKKAFMEKFKEVQGYFYPG